MQLMWDEPKRKLTLETRGMDFAALDLDFFLGAMVVPAKAGRFMAIGEFDGAVISVVFQQVGSEAISIVSMRRASRKERRLYDGP